MPGEVAGKIPIGLDTRPAEQDFAKLVNSKLSKTYNLRINVDDAVRPLGKISAAASDFEKSLSAANARVLAFGASVSALYAVEKAFAGIVKSTIDVQDQLAQINVILNQSPRNLAAFSDSLFNIAKNTGQSFQEVAKAATELSRQGLGAEQTLLRTRDALILTRLSGLDTVRSVEALTAAINSFSQESLTSTQIINKLANVDANFAVSSKDLAESLERAGASAADAGVSFNSFLALVTAVQQTTQRGGAVIGNAFKTIFTRVQRPEVLNDLEALGITVRSVSGEFLAADKVLLNTASVFDKLTQSQQSHLLETVGSVYQANQLRALFSDLSKGASNYDSALRTATNTTNEAISRNRELNDTLKSQLNATYEGLKQLGSKIGSIGLTPNLDGIVKEINGALSSINDKDSEDAGAVIGRGLVKGISSFIFGPGAVLLLGVIGKLGVDLAKFSIESVKNLLSLNSLNEKARNIAAEYSAILANEPELLNRINQGTITQIELNEKLLALLVSQSSVRANQLASINIAAKEAVGSTLLGGQGVSFDAKTSVVKTKNVPNFAESDLQVKSSLDGLQEAIKRERNAGIPPSSIKVGTDARLVNEANPLGLGVYNLRDEPLGLGQGISRAISKGINPKTKGVVPGFAENTFRSTLFPSDVVSVTVEKAIQEFRASLRTGTANINELTNVVDKLSQSLLLTTQSSQKLKQKLIYIESNTFPDVPKQSRLLLSEKASPSSNDLIGSFQAAQSRYATPIQSTNIKNPPPSYGSPLFFQYGSPGFPTQRNEPGNLPSSIDAAINRLALKLGSEILPNFQLKPKESFFIPFDYPTKRSKRQGNLPDQFQAATRRFPESIEDFLSGDDKQNFLRAKRDSFAPSVGNSSFIQELTSSINPRIAKAEKAAQDFAEAESQRINRLSNLSKISSNIVGGGYVDDQYFSRSRATKALNLENAGAAQAARQERSRRLTNLGFGLSVAAPIASSIAAESFGPQTTAGKIANVIGSTASFGGLGASFTPVNPLLGGGIGAAAGLFIGLAGVLGGVSHSLKEFQRSLELSKENLNKDSDQLNRFVAIQQQITDILSGRVKSTPETLADLQSQRDQIFSSFPEARQQQIGEIGKTGNFDKLSSLVNSFTSENSKNLSVEDFAKQIPLLTEVSEKERPEALKEFYSSFGSLRNKRGETVFSQLQKYPNVANALSEFKTTGKTAVPYDLEDTVIGSFGKNTKVVDSNAVKESIKSFEKLIDALEFDPSRTEVLKRAFRETFGKSGGIELIAQASFGLGESLDERTKQVNEASKKLKSGDTQLIKNTDFGKIFEQRYNDLKLELSRSSLTFESSQLKTRLGGENVIEAEKGNLSVEKLFSDPQAILARQKEIDLLSLKNSTDLKSSEVAFTRSQSFGKAIEEFESTLKNEKKSNSIFNIEEFSTLAEKLRTNRDKPEEVLKIIEEFQTKNKDSTSFNSSSVKPIIDNLVTSIKTTNEEANSKQENILTEQKFLIQRLNESFKTNIKLENIGDLLKSGGGVQGGFNSQLQGLKLGRLSQIDLGTVGNPENRLKIAEFIRDDLRGTIPDRFRSQLEKDRADQLRPQFGAESEAIAQTQIENAFKRKYKTDSTGAFILKDGKRIQDTSEDVSPERITGNKASEVFLLGQERTKELNLNLSNAKTNLEAMAQSGTSFAEEMHKAQLDINDLAIKAGKLGDADFAKSFYGALEYGKDEFLRDFSHGLADTANDLKGAFSGVLKELARGGDLKSVGVSLGYKLLDRSIDLGTNSIVGGLTGVGKTIAGAFTGQSRGGLIGYAGGGTVKGGSGTKDDVPAFLTAGEFVINRKAAQTIGYSNLDRINNGRLGRFANGGVPANQSIDYTLSNTVIRDGDNEIYKIDPRLSDFAKFDPNNPANQARNQLSQDIINYNKAKKAFNDKRNGAILSAYIAAATNIGGAGISAGISSYASSSAASAASSLDPGQEINLPNIRAGSIDPGHELGSIPSQSYNTYNFQAARYANLGGMIRAYASGGSVDNIPAMLTGGEYVVSKSAVSKFGVPFFQDLNAGKIRKFANGGYAGGAYSVDGSSDSMDRLIEATDNLRKILEDKQNNKTPDGKPQDAANANNVTINVTVNNSASGATADVAAQSNNKTGGITEKDAVALGNTVRAVVLQELNRQSRPGGLIYNQTK